MVEKEDTTQHPEPEPPPPPPDPPATEEEIAGLDNYFEKGLRDRDEE